MKQCVKWKSTPTTCNFDMYQLYVSSEVGYMRESLANAARIMSEQSEALAGAHLMDEGSTLRILEFGRRNELADMELDISFKKVNKHDIDITHNSRMPFVIYKNNTMRRKSLQNNSGNSTRDFKKMYGLCCRERGNEPSGVGNYIIKIGCQCRGGDGTVMVKDQQLVQMQSQITEFAGSMMNALVNG